MARIPFPSIAEFRSLQFADYRLQGRKNIARLPGAWAHLEAAFQGATHEDVRRRIFGYPARRVAEGAANATVRNELSQLRRGMRLAVMAGALDEVPPFPTITVRNARTGFVDGSQFERIRQQLPAALKGIALLGFLIGWRKAEILGLRWDQVDLRANVARIEDTKNGEARSLPFGSLDELRKMFHGQDAARAVAEARNREVCVTVFQRHGRPIRHFDGAWKRACKRAGVGEILFHDLRRSAVRNFERAGVPRSVAMQLTGHKCESVYRRYAITCERDLSEGLEKLAWLRDGMKRPPAPRTSDAGRMVFAGEDPSASYEADMIASPRRSS